MVAAASCWPLAPCKYHRACREHRRGANALPGPLRPVRRHQQPAARQRVVPPVGDVVQDVVAHGVRHRERSISTGEVLKRQNNSTQTGEDVSLRVALRRISWRERLQPHCDPDQCGPAQIRVLADKGHSDDSADSQGDACRGLDAPQDEVGSVGTPEQRSCRANGNIGPLNPAETPRRIP